MRTLFHFKHIAQTKDLAKHVSNTYGGVIQSGKTMTVNEKVYRVIPN
jgi:hypothetical protein